MPLRPPVARRRDAWGGYGTQVRHLRAKMAQDVYDVQAWDQVFEELKTLPITDETRAIYEELLAVFSTKADVWCKYAELELGAGNLAGLKTIFQRCLMSVPSLELWSLYMKFIRRSNKGQPGWDGRFALGLLLVLLHGRGSASLVVFRLEGPDALVAAFDMCVHVYLRRGCKGTAGFTDWCRRGQGPRAFQQRFRQTHDGGCKGPEGAVEVRNALDFTLEVAGQDINSGPFWQDSIQHLQGAKTGSPEFAALFPQASGRSWC
ncbi:Cleavage stimulation factor subunit 3 [Tetrabaena socialis]|uniref:Cleavage stimulation factor subunit 3 n=1 Tax=Tetrabaena socialis TaxID=47790 RepID=A0A2J8AFH3_9CHLO|nr:Cleavage stimulation factor subunit 3 [Tetrabaena socialis]|eukprot:PNH11275.1 Cleavage stimulation factor subunit 3 [Tetrabaena socialis]